MNEQTAPPEVSERARRVIDALELNGPELPIVVLARHAGLVPTQLTAVLDELHDAGLVAPGEAPQSVRLLPRDGTGRFRPRSRAPEEAHLTRTPPRA